MVRFEFGEAWKLLNGETPDSLPIEQVFQACSEIGYPVFIRSDQFSAKHRGPSAYKLEERDRDKLLKIFTEIVRANSEAWAYPSALMIREFLDLEVNNSFRAFDGTLIGQERRIFTVFNEPVCSHYYWPKEAIDFNDVEEPGDWEEKHRRLSGEDTPNFLLQAASTASKVSSEGTGYEYLVPWSIDFAETSDGNWFLIDMAHAINSGHPKNCKGRNEIEEMMMEKVGLG